jgi:cholesterol transport system auxiliary component
VKRWSILIAWALLASGCTGSLLDSHADKPQVYRLAAVAVAPGGEPLAAALSVARPRAASSLDTERIAVVQPGSVFDYFAGVRWSEPAPQMLQQVLVEALVSDGRFATTVAAPSRVPAEYLLDIELRQFAAYYVQPGAPPQVQVQWQATLVDTRSGARVTTFVVGTQSTASGNHRGAVVSAFEQATSAAVRDTLVRLREGSAGLVR